MKKLNWLGNLILIAIVAGSLTGCSVVRLMEVATAHKTVIDKETRRTGIEKKKDVKLSLSPMGDGFGLRLQYQPHYEVQSRSIMRSRGGDNFLSSSIAWAEYFTLMYVAMDLFGLFDYLEDSDSPEESEASSLDWSTLKTWEKAVIIGVPSDFLLWSMTKNFRPTKRTPWEPSHTTPGTLKEVPNHPITISLSQLGYTETYLTNSTGELTILAHDLISKIPGQKLDVVLHTDSIKVDASTNVGGVKEQQSFIRDRSSALFRALYKEADERR